MDRVNKFGLVILLCINMALTVRPEYPVSDAFALFCTFIGSILLLV